MVRLKQVYFVVNRPVMGRSKGIVEVHLDEHEVKEISGRLLESIPAEHKGVVSVDPLKLFGSFAVKGALADHTK